MNIPAGCGNLNHLLIFVHQKKNMWEQKDQQLHRVFEFKDFSEAFAFMTRVALIAEKHNHHPKWTNVWNRVELWLSTHEAGNKITDQDRQLADAIDRLLF